MTLDASTLQAEKTTLRERHVSPGEGPPKLSMVELTPLLVLSIIESNCFEVGKRFKILPGGLMKTSRKNPNGVTYIGATMMANDEVYNDIVFSNKEKDIGKRHAMIKYDPSDRKYRIKDMRKGTGTFSRIEGHFPVRDSTIVSFSDAHI